MPRSSSAIWGCGFSVECSVSDAGSQNVKFVACAIIDEPKQWHL